MPKKDKPNLAFLTSAEGGLSHYTAHLFGPASKYFNTYYVTYADTSVDDLVLKKVKKVYQLVKKEDPLSIISTLKFLREKKIDFINFNVATTARKMYFHNVALLSQAKLLGIKIIGTMHDVMPFESFYVDPAALELLYSCIDHYIVGNETEANKLQLYFQVPPDKITIANHGPYLLFNQNKYSKESARHKLKISKDRKVFLFFGWLRPHKGLDLLVKAFKEVNKKAPKTLLFISSDLKYSPQLNELIRNVEKSGLSKNTKIFKKYVPSSEIEPIFKASDVVVLPYTMVSQSGILNLAFAFKKPVIVSDIFSEAQTIDHRAGLVTKTGDYKDLAECLSEFVDLNDSEMKKMGEYGYRYAVGDNSWDSIAQKMFKISKRLGTK